MKTSNTFFVLVSLSFLFIFKGLPAQEMEKRQRFLSVYWGIGNLMRQDLTTSPMVYKKWSPANVSIKYHRAGKFDHRITGGFGLYNPKTAEMYTYYWDDPQETFTTYPHNFYLADLIYSLGKTVHENNKLKIVAGAQFKTRLNYSIYSFGPVWTPNYYLSFGTEAWAEAVYNTNKGEYNVGLSLPLFAWVARSPYLNQDDLYFEAISKHNSLKALKGFVSNGKIRSWGKTQGMDLEIGYHHSLSEKWDIGGTYRLCLNLNEAPASYTSVLNTLYISGKLKF